MRDKVNFKRSFKKKVIQSFPSPRPVSMPY